MSHDQQEGNVGKKSMCLVYVVFFLLLLIAAVAIVMKRGYQLDFG